MVALSKKGEQLTPKVTCLIHITCNSPSLLQRNQWKSCSPGLRASCRKAFDTSSVESYHDLYDIGNK